jgi:hypothetical protein
MTAEEIEIAKLTVEQYKELKAKAQKWDDLYDEVGEYYETYDDDGKEIPPVREGDLCDIGEAAATALGYM